MKYTGMPFGMWMLFAGSFQKQLTAVLGYNADTAKAIITDVRTHRVKNQQLGIALFNGFSDLLLKIENAQHLPKLFAFGAILDVFVLYEGLYDGGKYNFSLMVRKPAIRCFGAIEKRHIAAALLLCPEDGARGLFSYLLCFFLLPTTAVPMAALPLTSIRTTSKAGLLVSPVCGMVY